MGLDAALLHCSQSIVSLTLGGTRFIRCDDRFFFQLLSFGNRGTDGFGVTFGHGFKLLGSGFALLPFEVFLPGRDVSFHDFAFSQTGLCLLQARHT